MSTLITNGRLVDPQNKVDEITDILIDAAGNITAIGNNLTVPNDAKKIDATDKWIFPGLVDLCTRLREPGHEHKGTIASETHAAVAGGVTTVCAQPDTAPVTDDPSVAELILRRNRDAGNARVIPLAALTKGLEGKQLTEMALLKDAGCLALSDAGRPIQDSRVLKRAIEYAQSYGVPIMLTPNDPTLSADGCAHEGTLATRLGLNGIPTSAETVAIGRYTALAHDTGSSLHVNQISTKQSLVFLSTANANGVVLTADVAIHQLFLTEMDISEFDSACHVIPPLRRIEDREALRAAVKNGTIQVVTSDHQPHEPDAKLAPFPATDPGISGVQLLLPLMLRLVEEELLTLSRAIELVTSAPAKILGIDSGHLGIGSKADLTIVDPDCIWRPANEPWYSTGHNTPFKNWEFTGKVVRTLVQGRDVFVAD